MLNRRQFIAAAGSLCLVGGVAGAAPPRARPPFRLLYGNDTTNILTCVSPYHRQGEPFRPEMLEASVDEVAGLGVDAHLLQPGLCWVAWWPSKVYPAEEHYRWLKERYGLSPDSFGRYVLAGGDLAQVFIDRCRLRGQSPFISFRLNDAHAKEWADAKPGDKIGGGASQGLTRFYCEHPEYRIGTKAGYGADQVLNWAISAVRDHKFALIEELCENYDLDGLELDFLRFYSFFQLDKTSVEERRAIMTAFVGRVRALLDRTAREGRRRWLCLRTPCYLAAHDPLGLDLPALAAAGADMINVSASYFTVQNTDLAAIRQLVPQAGVYAEMCHSIWNGRGGGYDTFPFRRATREQIQTAAHLACSRGADGVSLFNFVYYREHGGPGRGPFCEPPFDMLKHLGDAPWLARQPQHYFLAAGWRSPFFQGSGLPRDVGQGKTIQFTLDAAPPVGGWRQGGRLRLQAESDLEGSDWSAQLNGVDLPQTADVSEPYPNPYPTMLGDAKNTRAWSVPRGVLRDGINRIDVKLSAGSKTRLEYVDLAIA
jgi:hypothetical protein